MPIQLLNGLASATLAAYDKLPDEVKQGDPDQALASMAFDHVAVMSPERRQALERELGGRLTDTEIKNLVVLQLAPTMRRRRRRSASITPNLPTKG